MTGNSLFPGGSHPKRARRANAALLSAIMTLTAAGLAGCAAKPSGGETVPVATSTPDSPSIYYRTQSDADIDLMAFGRAHPNCQVWTNWQKLCTNLDDGGPVSCIRDAQRPARPSKPFCVVNGASVAGYPYAAPAGVRPSVDRFCRRFEMVTSFDNSGETRDRHCTEYRRDRPFFRVNSEPLNTAFIRERIRSRQVDFGNRCPRYETLGSETNTPPPPPSILIDGHRNPSACPIFLSYCPRWRARAATTSG